MFNIEEELKKLPAKPGVYIMRDDKDTIIYVGKAIVLKNRVRQYFQNSRNHTEKIRQMVGRIDHFEYIITDSELEALVLECNLIKEEHPKYNVRLRDDKQYPWVKVTLAERFPQVYITRKIKQDGSKYYGPYTDVGAIRETFRLLRQIFPLRSCRKELDREKVDRPCLNFHIQRCLAPCCGGITPQAYLDMIRQVCLFLEGRQGELSTRLRQEMLEAAARQEYEKAGQLRDKVRDVEKVLEKQRVISGIQDDADIFGVAQDRQGSAVQVLQVRQGKMIGREYFMVTEGDETPPCEVLEEFLIQYYDHSGFIPKEILLPVTLEGTATIAAWLKEQSGFKVLLKTPQKGERMELVRMAAENAQTVLGQERNKENQRQLQAEAILTELQQELNLGKLPFRIEGFDISNTQGNQAVASMVVFENGVPKGSDYRRFRIKTIEGPNDFAMLQEAVRRRFRRGLEERQELLTENGKFAKFPDLLLIDGGKGQLSSVMEIIAELGLTHIPVIGLAKQEEEVYRPDTEEPLRLSRRSNALMLLQRVRDEAHRFAITYHKSLRDRRTVESALDRIQGIGPKKKQLLLKHFGSVKRICEATLEELAALPGINRKTAASIKVQLETV